METDVTRLKEETIRLLDEVPGERMEQVRDFVLFVTGQSNRRTPLTLKTIPAKDLLPLIGIASFGGDALEDSERIWDDSE